jgi:hypothetical protein
MSQVTLPDSIDSSDRSPSPVEKSPRSATPPGDVPPGFDFKPVPVLVPVTLFLGIASSFALLAEIGVVICVVGVAVGTLTLWKLRRSGGEFGGHRLATTGLVASAFFFFAGIATHVYAYATEVPEGHYRVNFSKDISDKQFETVNGQRQLHPAVAPLEGQKIYIKGYMWNTKIQTGLVEFILLKDNGKCCFGGNPKPYDMMHIILKDGLTIDKMDGLVSVAGTLKCDVTSGHAVYVVEATQAGRARTTH